jgi:hypothetical protein
MGAPALQKIARLGAPARQKMKLGQDRFSP